MPSPRQRRRLTDPVLPPPVVAALMAAGQAATARRAPTRRSLAAALVPAGVSGALWVTSLVRFRVRGTTWSPYGAHATSALVTTGPNAITRNPMYVGMATALVAHAVARRSPSGLAWVAAFVAVMDRTQVAYEERHLAETFGDEFRDYASRVRRWL